MRKFSNECQAYDALSDPHSFKGGDTRPDLITGWQVREMMQPGSTVSMNNMAKNIDKTASEVEAKADKNGIITKQSEVYVWNDTLFASYKSAHLASIKSELFRAGFKKQYPTYTKSDLDATVNAATNNPRNYNLRCDVILELFAEFVADK